MRTSHLLLVIAASAAMNVVPLLAAAQSYGPATPDTPSATVEAQPGEVQAYQRDWADYQMKLSDYHQRRAAYDRQVHYRQPNMWWRYDNRGYNRNVDVAQWGGRPCAELSGNNTAVGGLFGALAGAAIGSNLADRGSRGEGAVLGAVAGGAIGASIASNSARCDGGGYYYSYNQTSPYRESSYYRGRNSGRYDYAYYRRGHCRLVVAPTRWNGAEETRYVRVCPDNYGRYRLAD